MPTEEQFSNATKITRWPPNASEEYINARNDLLKEEWELHERIEKVAALRQKLPKGSAMKSYTFTEGPSDLTQSGPIKETTLEDLAADGRTVLIRHYMWDPSDAEPCPHCCSALDAWDAMAPNLADRVTFVIVAKAEIERFRTLGTKRNWKNLRLLSSFGSDFNREMNVESVAWTEVKQLPGLSVFKKDAEGVVRHFYTDLANYDADTIGYDFYGGYRNFFDFAPEGRGGF